MWQQITVWLIVCVAVLSLLWRFAPVRWRQRMQRKVPALGRVSNHACGDCAGCHSESGSEETKV